MNERQYPHYLFEEDVTGAKTYVCRCREETLGWDPEVTFQVTLFGKRSSLIQIPKGERKLDIDTIVFVTNDAGGTNERVRGTVLKYDEGRFHNRLWI